MTPYDKLKQNVDRNPSVNPPKERGPLWEGPSGEGRNGGVTYSLLSRYLTCRRRAEIRLMDGLRAADSFSVPIQYGNLWHVMEETWAQTRDLVKTIEALHHYGRELCLQYRLQQDAVANWVGIACTLFPVYLDYWKNHPDVKNRTPLLQEQTFDVSYVLPSDREVRLRGKWDSNDLVGKGENRQIWLQENKTKGRIDEVQLKRNLTFDLQTMMYLTALSQDTGIKVLEDAKERYPIAGVRYNVIKRPAQYQGKKETPEGFLERLKGIVKESPKGFFMRWHVLVLPEDVLRFRYECLDPILETICDDYEWWTYYRSEGLQWWDSIHRKQAFPDHCSRYWRHPYGIVNFIDESGTSDLDHMLNTGSEAGLERTVTLFRELEV